MSTGRDGRSATAGSRPAIIESHPCGVALKMAESVSCLDGGCLESPYDEAYISPCIP